MSERDVRTPPARKATGGTTAAARETLRPSGTFASDGLCIHYESYGQGDPILLVHGWGSDMTHNWIATGWLDALRSERQVILLDVRGHGRSDRPLHQDAYGYRAMSRDVLALMDTFGIRKADYLGYSMGAFMGAYLLGHHAERFGAMILGGIGDETEESIAAARTIAAALRAEDAAQVRDPLGAAYRRFVDQDPRNDATGREALALAALQMWPEGFPRELAGPDLAGVRNPVLVVNGERDLPYVLSDRELVAAIPNARHVRIPGQDHVGAVADRRFIEAALGFLRSMRPA